MIEEPPPLSKKRPDWTPWSRRLEIVKLLEPDQVNLIFPEIVARVPSVEVSVISRVSRKTTSTIVDEPTNKGVRWTKATSVTTAE
jgi:hypothetical protein